MHNWKRQGISLPEGFRENMAQLTPWFQLSVLQNCERVSFYKPTQCAVLFHDNLSKLMSEKVPWSVNGTGGDKGEIASAEPGTGCEPWASFSICPMCNPVHLLRSPTEALADSKESSIPELQRALRTSLGAGPLPPYYVTPWALRSTPSHLSTRVLLNLEAASLLRSLLKSGRLNHI